METGVQLEFWQPTAKDRLEYAIQQIEKTKKAERGIFAQIEKIKKMQATSEAIIEEVNHELIYGAAEGIR